MNALPAPLQWVRLNTLTYLGRSARLFPVVARFGSGRSRLVSASTGISIEAPPRSGNSFFVTGFSMANPGVEVAHHHHVPAQVFRSLELGVPVTVLLRNPMDSALAKAAPGEKPFLIGTTLRRWISFWDTIYPVLDQVVVAKFEDLIREPGAVIGQVNSKFDRSFSTAFPSTDDVFALMERTRLSRADKASAAKPNPNIPSDEIAERESRLRPQAEEHALASEALTVYERTLAHL